jgi:hypothetical protein
MSLQKQIWLQRAGLLNENFGEDHDYKSLKPYHSFKTNDNHDINVHLFNNENGKHAVFHNKNLNAVTKLVHWNHGSETPSKEDLEKASHEEHDDEKKLMEEKNLTPDAAGKIAEHSSVVHMIGHMHKQKNTYGSEAHKKEIAPHEAEIKKLGHGAHPHQVELRREHGKVAANAALESLKMEHGPKVKIHAVGHTSKSGDIGRFTKGKHNDGQENTSDVAVHVKNSIKGKHKDEDHYSGYSLKSSSKSSTITAKNPAIHMGGLLDHPTRKLGAEKVSREGLKKVHQKMGHAGKSAAERAKILDAARKSVKESYLVESPTDLELKANEHAKPVKTAIAKEFHEHLHHLTNNVGPEGHHMIGKMLRHHLTPETSMPYSKIHVKGDEPHKVHATVTAGSESPLHKIFKNKTSRYAATRHGDRVTIHHVEKDGSHTALAHYSPKTKSNAFKSDVHGWNVLPANTHSKK